MILLLIGLMLALFWGWPYVWFGLIRRHITVNISVNKTVVEIGHPVEVKCVVSNQAQIGCPSLRLRITLPDGLVSDDEEAGHYLQIATNLRRRESIVFTMRIRATRRGPQSFEQCPVELVLSDARGLNRHVIQHQISHELFVMPTLLDAQAPELVPKGLLGEIEVRRWLHRDEAMIRGIRTYQYGDPFKYIAWMSSAATGSWMVKEFLSSSESTVHLVLSAQFQEEYWLGTDRDAFDVLCSEVVSVARRLSDKGFQLQFWTNALWQRDVRRRSFGRQSPSSMRTLLGGLQPIAADSLERVLRLLLTQPVQTPEVIVFAKYLSEPTKALIRGGGKLSNIKVCEPLIHKDTSVHGTQRDSSSSDSVYEHTTTSGRPSHLKSSDLQAGG